MTTIPAKIDLTIYQGATFSEVFEWKTQADDGSAPVAVNLTGCTARMQVRESVDAFNWLLELTTENGGIVIIDPLLGRFTLALSPTATGALGFKDAVYDVEIDTAGGEVTRIMQGAVKLSPQVTR